MNPTLFTVLSLSGFFVVVSLLYVIWVKILISLKKKKQLENKK